MATRIRLQRHGSKGSPFYKIVVANNRVKRDGKFIELLGTYNPTTIPASIQLDVDKAVKWLISGAEPTPTAKAILSYKGAFYKKHLLRGVKLGVVKDEDVETKFAAWVESHLNKVIDHQKKAADVKKAKIEASVNAPGKVREIPVVEPELTEQTEVAAETETTADVAAEATTETTTEATQENAE